MHATSIEWLLSMMTTPARRGAQQRTAHHRHQQHP